MSEVKAVEVKEVKDKPMKKERVRFEGGNYVFYLVKFKTFRELLGATCEASIWSAHILAKAKKEISKMNRLAKRMGELKPQITESKEISELKGIIRAYQEMLGRKETLPETITELLDYAKGLEEEFTAESETAKTTVFMRDGNGHAMLSSHIIVGNLKENLKIIFETGDRSIVTSKVNCGRLLALDVKPMEEFLIPSLDIARKEDGTPKIVERPIRFLDKFGQEQSAISRSEYIPEGATFQATLRCRRGSPFAEKETLERLFDLGKNNGIGPWRGSGNRGAYKFIVEELPGYSEPADADGYR